MRNIHSLSTLICLALCALTQALPVEQGGQGAVMPTADATASSDHAISIPQSLSERDALASLSLTPRAPGPKPASKFKMEDVVIELCEGVTEEEFKNYKPFKNWWTRMKANLALQKRFSLTKIEVQSALRFDMERKTPPKFYSTIITLKDAKPKNPKFGTFERFVFFRGPAVGMLVVLEEEEAPHQKWTLLTIQPRHPAASFQFVELPAGMVDDSSFQGAAAKEIKEELDMEIPEKDLINMSELAARKPLGGEQLPKAMWPSAGGTEEYIQLFLHEKKLPKDKIKEFKNKATGLLEENEEIKLKLIKLEDLWTEGSTDAKALSALALYNALKAGKKI